MTHKTTVEWINAHLEQVGKALIAACGDQMPASATRTAGGRTPSSSAPSRPSGTGIPSRTVSAGKRLLTSGTTVSSMSVPASGGSTPFRRG